jgi:hypothetical protein
MHPSHRGAMVSTSAGFEIILKEASLFGDLLATDQSASGYWNANKFKYEIFKFRESLDLPVSEHIEACHVMALLFSDVLENIPYEEDPQLFEWVKFMKKRLVNYADRKSENYTDPASNPASNATEMVDPFNHYLAQWCASVDF